MKVIIISVTTGRGHNSTARALADELAAHDIQTTELDLYRCCGHSAYKLIENGYLFVTRRMKTGFRRVYGILEHSSKARRVYSFAARREHIADRLFAAVKDSLPDAFIVTHPYAAQALDILKKRGALDTPVIALDTDYCVQPFIEDSTSLEAICLASPLLLPEAIKKGIAPHRTFATGLPVCGSFLRRIGLQSARRELGLDIDRKTVLVMGGSMGYGYMYDTVKQLSDVGLQVLCICGDNRRLLCELESTALPGVTSMGFTDRVSLCMDASDLIVTKPGGLTVTELMVKGLPAVLTMPIPGHEEHNLSFLLSIGGAVSPGEAQLGSTVLALLDNDAKRAAMSAALLENSLPNACSDICSLTRKLALLHRVLP